MPVRSSDASPEGAPRSSLDDFALRRGTAADLPSVAELSQAVYGVRRTAESVRWLYQDNPAGPCAFWLAEELATTRVVAMRPVFPWRVRAGAGDVVVGQAGDAMTHPDFQGRGLFSALVRAAWTELSENGASFAFSFSNPGSLSVYRKIVVGQGDRAGTHVVLQFRRLVYPLSMGLVGERLGGPARLLKGMDIALRAYQRLCWTLPAHLSEAPVDRFDGEFDELWTRAADGFGVLTVRDSRYLNWRFIDAPSGRYQVIAIRSRGALAGYVAFETDGRGSGSIADLFGVPDPEVLGALLAASLRTMLSAGCLRASLWMPMESRLFTFVRRFGFLARRDTFPMAVHVFADAPASRLAVDGSQWLAWFGDRDVEHLVTPAIGPQ